MAMTDSFWPVSPEAVRFYPPKFDHDHVCRGLFERAQEEIVSFSTGHPSVEMVGLIQRCRASDDPSEFTTVLLINDEAEENI